MKFKNNLIMLPGSRSNEKQILASIAIVSIFADIRIIRDYSEAQNSKRVGIFYAQK